MVLFRSPEEREREAQERAEADRAQAEWTRRQQEQAAANAAATALAAAPAGRARTAYARGDRWFQIEIEVSALSGSASRFGSSDNAVVPAAESADVLGRIEDEGWRLEHTGFVFVETGSTSTDRLLGTGQGTVTRGVVTGIYLFRRTAGPAPA